MDTSHTHDELPESLELQHEVRDVSVRPIVYFGIGLFFLVFVSFVLMRAMFGILDHQAEALDVKPAGIKTERPQEPPQPRLQTTPVPARKQVQANENSLLNSYGWVNEKTGTVRIPIQRAMEILAERHLPARAVSGADNDEPEKVGRARAPKSESSSAVKTDPRPEESTGRQPE